MKGGSDCWRHRASFFCYEKLAERSTESFAVKSSDTVAGEVDILYYNFIFLCLVKANCNFPEERSWRFCTTSYLQLMKLIPEPFLYHFIEINWIDTHWRGTRRCSPVKGVNSVINFCLWLSDSVFFSPTYGYQFFFSFMFKHLISINTVSWITQTGKHIL